MPPGVRFSEVSVPTRNGPRRVCVVAPQRNIVLSRNRLELMRVGQSESELDQLIVDHIAGGKGYHALVFRGADDTGSFRYGLGPDFTSEERLELVELLLRAHLRFFRAIERHGVFALLGVEFSERDAQTYETAVERVGDSLARELRHAEGDRADQLRLDQWLLESQATWSAMPYALFLETKLATAIVAAERQHRRFTQMPGHDAPT